MVRTHTTVFAAGGTLAYSLQTAHGGPAIESENNPFQVWAPPHGCRCRRGIDRLPRWRRHKVPYLPAGAMLRLPPACARALLPRPPHPQSTVHRRLTHRLRS